MDVILTIYFVCFFNSKHESSIFTSDIDWPIDSFYSKQHSLHKWWYRPFNGRKHRAPAAPNPMNPALHPLYPPEGPVLTSASAIHLGKSHDFMDKAHVYMLLNSMEEQLFVSVVTCPSCIDHLRHIRTSMRKQSSPLLSPLGQIKVFFAITSFSCSIVVTKILSDHYSKNHATNFFSLSGLVLSHQNLNMFFLL